MMITIFRCILLFFIFFGGFIGINIEEGFEGSILVFGLSAAFFLLSYALSM